MLGHRSGGAAPVIVELASSDGPDDLREPGDAERSPPRSSSDRLAACVNVLANVTSIYRWQDRVNAIRRAFW